MVGKIEARSIGSKCTGFFCHFHAIHYEGKTRIPFINAKFRSHAYIAIVGIQQGHKGQLWAFISLQEKFFNIIW